MTEEEARDAIVKAAVKLVADWPEIRPNEGWTGPVEDLSDAVAAYRRTTTPEPFDMFVGRSADGSMSGTGSRVPSALLKSDWAQVWRCTVTPIERVR